jgi:hypothetical protein
MKLPWVSRERYDEKVRELALSEQRRQELLDRILGTPAVAPEAFVEALTKKAIEDPENFAPTPYSSETPSGLRRAAQEFANRQAGMVV